MLLLQVLYGHDDPHLALAFAKKGTFKESCRAFMSTFLNLEMQRSDDGLMLGKAGCARDKGYDTCAEWQVNLPAVPNALCLVMRDDKTLRFLKYVSRDAPSSRADISASYRVDAPEDSEGSPEGSPD
eukprot:s2722_g14.t1